MTFDEYESATGDTVQILFEFSEDNVVLKRQCRQTIDLPVIWKTSEHEVCEAVVPVPESLSSL
jgi:hypothetical protein